MLTLGEGPYGESGDDGDDGKEGGADAEGAAAGAALFVAAAPVEDRFGEDVVEQFVAGRLTPGRVDLAQDPPTVAATELLEHGCDLGLGSFRPIGKVRGGVRDLCVRARHEIAKRVGGNRLLAACQAAERILEVVGDDPLRAAERLEPGACQLPGAGLDGRDPHPVHHELQERRLDRVRAPTVRSVRARAVRGVGFRALAGADPPPSRGVDHRVNERRLDRVVLGLGQPAVPLLDRSLDRLPCRVGGELLDPQVILKQPGDPVLEAVELRPRVLTDRDHEMHPQIDVVDDRREHVGKRAGTVLIRVIEKVVLELVEHDEQRPHPPRPTPQHVQQRLAGLPSGKVLAAGRLDRRAPDLSDQRAQRIVPPRPERADRERRPRTRRLQVLQDPLVQLADHARLQQRALPNPTGAVHDRQPRSAQVPRHDPRLLIATEEELRILLPVGNQTDIRRQRAPGRVRIAVCLGHDRRRGGERGLEPLDMLLELGV